MSRKLLIVAAALAALLVGATSAQAQSHQVIVGAGDDNFSVQADGPIVQGDTVEFVWQENGHDLGMGGGEETNVGEQRDGFRLVRTVDRAGIYGFSCSLHDDMSGQFEVAEKAGAGPRTERKWNEVDIVLDADGDGGVSPANVTIEEGQTVHWNGGKESYTVSVAGRSGTAQFGGEPFKHTFTQPGTYSYSSSEGNGTITVVEAGSINDGIRLAPAGSTPAATVSVSSNSFSPNAVTIDEGQVVQWNWTGGLHNVKFADGTGFSPRSSGSGALKFYVPRDTAYTYQCTLHQGMTGTVLVNDTGAAGPNEQPPAPDANVGGDAPGDADGPGDSPTGGSRGTGSGVTGLAAAAASVAGRADQGGGRDSARPVLRALKARFRRGRRANRLRLTTSEDVQLQVSMRRLGRSSDLVTRRAMKLYARKGTRSVKLPVLNLSRGTYRLRVVAIDQAGNRSAPITLRLTVR